MTTKITVDAHAGWDVKVTQRDLNAEGGHSDTEIVVPKNTKQDFYIHSHRQIVGVEEVPA